MRPPSEFHQRHIRTGAAIIVKWSLDDATCIATRVREHSSQADALLFGRVTNEMYWRQRWRPPARTGARPDWMERPIRPYDRRGKEVRMWSSTLDRVDWNAELVRGDLGKAVQQLKRESGKGLSWEA